MKQNNQLFNDVFKQMEKKPTKQQPQQQTNKANLAKGIALGIFGIIAVPMVIKIFMKGPTAPIIIGAYWIIVIGVGLFFLAAFVRKKFFKG